MEICSLEVESENAIELNRLLHKEWPDLGEFDEIKHGVVVPRPIAVLKNREIIGGLSYTSYKEPNAEGFAVWVNAVYVAPKYRHQGVASKLVQASHNEAGCLYALTDIPALYTKNGWVVVNANVNGAVVKYSKNI